MPLADRAALRGALAATLVKSAAHRPVFDTLFEVCFPLPARRGAGGGARGGGDLPARLEQALAGGAVAALDALAAEAVARAVAAEPGRPLSLYASVQRALRCLDLDGALARLAGAGGEPPVAGPLAARLAAAARQRAAARLRAAVEAEARRRLVAERGPSAAAAALRRRLPEDVDFMHAEAAQLAAVRRVLPPLGRRLAARLARRRRHRRAGPLDVRATLRRSLSAGGVPLDVRHRRPHPAKPELVVLADVSGSVAAFARFTLQLVHALAGEFARVRSFVFVDGVDEVTALLAGAEDFAGALRRVDAEADVVWGSGHSDYGRALAGFLARWPGAVGPRTTVLVLGDARSNYHDPQAWALAEVARRARRVYWLNPEPRAYWDTGDSIAGLYGAHCDGTFECRNLRQLQQVVARVG